MSKITAEVKMLVLVTVSTLICFSAAIGVTIVFNLETIDATLCGFIGYAINSCFIGGARKHLRCKTQDEDTDEAEKE